MSRRNNKAASQAEKADLLVSALSEAASSSSSSAPIHATRGASSAALLAKDSATHGSQLVATSSFSPISSVRNTASSVFLTEDDVPPSNQLEAQKLVVHGTTSLVPPGGLQLPDLALPLSELQMETAYSLLCTLRTFCCANPGVLDTTAALVQFPPVDDARSPYQVPPPESAWPIPQLPLNVMSLHGTQSGE